jgi:hypothetical protein
VVHRGQATPIVIFTARGACTLLSLGDCRV